MISGAFVIAAGRDREMRRGAMMRRRGARRRMLQPNGPSFDRFSAAGHATSNNSIEETGQPASMGKKSKKAAKSGAGKEVTPSAGKARREKIAALRDIEARIDALIERLETELQDKDVFTPFPEREECPVCFVPMPLMEANSSIDMHCCGKSICDGCFGGSFKAKFVVRNTLKAEGREPKNFFCPFCRTPLSSSHEEEYERRLRRIKANDTAAMNSLATSHVKGRDGVNKDEVRAFQLLLQAAELGDPQSIWSLGKMCHDGFGVTDGTDRSVKLFRFAAKMGYHSAHFFLGWYFIEQLDDDANNIELSAMAFKHWSFAARRGDSSCLESLQKLSDDVLALLQYLRFDVDMDEIKEAYEESRSVEWSEEREAIRKSLDEQI